MKTTAFIIMTLCLTPTFALNLDELLSWERAVQAFLNNSDLEVYSLQVTDEEVTFKYSVEDSDYPYLDIIFDCKGKGRIENGQPFFTTLTCEEEEPTLWDEF